MRHAQWAEPRLARNDMRFQNHVVVELESCVVFPFWSYRRSVSGLVDHHSSRVWFRIDHVNDDANSSRGVELEVMFVC